MNPLLKQPLVAVQKPAQVPEEAQCLIDILAKQRSDAENSLALQMAKVIVLQREVGRLTGDLAKANAEIEKLKPAAAPIPESAAARD